MSWRERWGEGGKHPQAPPPADRACGQGYLTLHHLAQSRIHFYSMNWRLRPLTARCVSTMRLSGSIRCRRSTKRQGDEGPGGIAEREDGGRSSEARSPQSREVCGGGRRGTGRMTRPTARACCLVVVCPSSAAAVAATAATAIAVMTAEVSWGVWVLACARLIHLRLSTQLVCCQGFFVSLPPQLGC